MDEPLNRTCIAVTAITVAFFALVLTLYHIGQMPTAVIAAAIVIGLVAFGCFAQTISKS